MRSAVALLLIAGCGRFAFDDRNDDAGNLIVDTTPGGVTSVAITPDPFTTSSTSFVPVPNSTMTVPASPGQRWLLLVSGTLQSTSLDFRSPQVHYLVDGVERGFGGTESIEAGRPGPWQHLYMIDGTTQPQTITFELADALAATTTLDHFHAVLTPLPAAADPLYASVDAPPLVTSTAYAPAAQLTLTPASPGEYLVLLLVNESEAPSTSDITTKWFDPMGIAWSPDYKNPRGSRQSHLIVRRVVLSGPSTITLQAFSVGAQSTVEYVRAIGLRISGLTSFDEATNKTAQLTTVTTPMIANTLVPQSVAAASKYLTFGTVRVDDDCSNTAAAARGVQFTLTGVESSAFEHVAGNCAAEMTYGYVGLSNTRPTGVSVSFHSGNGMNQIVSHRESTLFVVGVP